jgi:hypothetical protein
MVNAYQTNPAWRSVIVKDNITTDGVAPAAIITSLLPSRLAAPIMVMGCPVSDAKFVCLEVTYSATAREERRVEVQLHGRRGREKEAGGYTNGRWNSRVILTLGSTYMELEEPASELSCFSFRHENLLTRLQQTATDFRRNVKNIMLQEL